MRKREYVQRTGEKWAPGERALDITRAELGFKPEHVKRAGEVLVQLLESTNEKESRLAAERIRDEAGLTRVVTPTEQHHLHVSISPEVLALAQQHRPAAKNITSQATRDDGWKA